MKPLWLLPKFEDFPEEEKLLKTSRPGDSFQKCWNTKGPFFVFLNKIITVQPGPLSELRL